MNKLLLTSLAVLGSAFSLNASAVPVTYIGSASGPEARQSMQPPSLTLQATH